MENLGFLFAAYTIIWVVLFGYVISIFTRQRKLQTELDLLKEMFKEKQID